MTSAEPRPLTATLDVAAPADALWAVVSDVGRTGEWSPECRAVTALGGVRRGGLLLGRNRRGGTRWVTLSRITEVEPGRAIGWTVLTNRSQWRYELQSLGPDTTRVVQTRRTPRGEGRFALWFTRRFLDGQATHDDELEAGMADGLRRIAELATGVSAPAGRPAGDRDAR
ncbi:SRPBCC family protein [Jatrophihabitans fulvus]